MCVYSHCIHVIKQVLVCGMLFSFVLLLGLEIGTSQTWVRNAEYKVDPFGTNIFVVFGERNHCNSSLV